MRYAIISDVHANPEALSAVLASDSVRAADALICLGDLVGYYTNPNECVDVVRQSASVCIAGNHDLAVIGRLDASDFGRHARTAVEWTRPRLSAENRQYLAALPLTARVGDTFLCVHGALHPEPNPILHLSNTARIEQSFERLRSGAFGPRVCFFGHTHRAVAYMHDGQRVHTLSGAELELRRGASYLINPGSVGQPRDGDVRAAFAVFDSETWLLEFQRVAFDMRPCLERAREQGLLREPTLAERTRDVLGGGADLGRRLAGRAVHAARRSLLPR
jgi:diadenosine tetraphosphatase ApaH/serine/threonine PP2A family protein phosphatase